MSVGNKLIMSHISVVHWVVVVSFAEAFLSLFDLMAERGYSTINVGDVHDVSSFNVVKRLLAWSCPRDIVNCHLIPDESHWFSCQKFSFLKFVGWVQRISIKSLSLKLDTLWLCSFDIIDFHLVVRFVQPTMQVPRA